MASGTLEGCRILIVEDEYYLADDARSMLSDAGADVLGPVATAADAAQRIGAEPRIDAVLLDVNLRGEMAFGVAAELQGRAIPFVFVTGYDQAVIPNRFAGTHRVQKPVNARNLVRLLESIVQPAAR